LEHGLRPSFAPLRPIRRLRLLTRCRDRLMADRTWEMIRLKLMLEDASIKLSAVLSSLKTVSAWAMLGALIDGEDDPLVLADLAKESRGRRFRS
jgi:transposase